MSCEIDKTQLDACKRLCKAMAYSGVGMFEFKVNDTTGEWILIEFNARFWGSLPLAIASGIDFPRLYAECLLGLSHSKGKEYKRGVYSRDLTSDVFNIKNEYSLNKINLGKLIAIKKLFSRLSSFSRIIIGKESIDTFAMGDLRPFLSELELLLLPRFSKVTFFRKVFHEKYYFDLIFTSSSIKNPHKLEILLILTYGEVRSS